MATITITQTDSPSRSKMAGPCWIRIDDPETYASTKARSITADAGAKITVSGKAMLRRATRDQTERKDWTLWVTGNPEDTVTLRVGHGQWVEAVITGASEREPEPEVEAHSGAAQLYRVSDSPDRYEGAHQRVVARSPEQAIEATRRDWAVRFPASAGRELYAHPERLDPHDSRALDAESGEWTRVLPGLLPGTVTTPRAEAAYRRSLRVQGAVRAWRNDLPGAAELIQGMEPDERAEALARLGYGTPAHRDLIGR